MSVVNCVMTKEVFIERGGDAILGPGSRSVYDFPVQLGKAAQISPVMNTTSTPNLRYRDILRFQIPAIGSRKI